MNRNVLLLAMLAGCASAADGTDGDSSSGSSAFAVQLPATHSAAVLALVNYPGTDVDVLDRLVGLDARAARSIVAARSGPDGISPSADDVPFTTLAQLDAIPYVSAAALQKLDAYAQVRPAPASETVKTVVFQGWESQAVVWGVNQGTLAALDGFLDARAAQGLVDRRPFTSVADIGAVPYVGTSALEKLQGQALAWWNAMRGTGPLAGAFDGVVFDENSAVAALEIANLATAADLTAHGITSTAAADIIAARTYETLAELAAVSGVGTVTMNALHAYALSGQFGGGADCVDRFDGAVGPHLADLLFLSESDRPLDLVSFPGAGGVAPTATSVAALVKAAAGDRIYSRPVDEYFAALEMSSSSADPRANVLVETAVKAQLTDLVYIAIQPPAGTVDQALVDVYLLGRTSCGDLVGLHAISVET